MTTAHDETHEMHAEAERMVRAMLSAALAVADGHQRRTLRKLQARAAQQERPQGRDATPDRAPSAAVGVGVSAPDRPSRRRGRTTDRSQVQVQADRMGSTPGARERDAHLTGIVREVLRPSVAAGVLNDRGWPALRDALHHIERDGGDAGAELAAAAARSPVAGVRSPAAVLRWRLAENRTTPGETSESTEVDRDRDTGTVLRSLAADPIGVSEDYAQAQLDRDTNPERAQVWDDALRDEGIDPEQVRADADTLTPDLGDEQDTDRDAGPGGPDFPEAFLGTLAETGVDVDTARNELTPGAEAAPEQPRGQFADGADPARIAGQSHPRTIAEQLNEKNGRRGTSTRGGGSRQIGRDQDRGR